MQNNINNNEQDAFSEMIRQKLENHVSPVDSNSWDEIEARLKPAKRRIIPFWGWISGGAAVAALALMFMLRPTNETKDSYVKTAGTHQTTTQPKQIAKVQTIKTVQPTKSTSIHAKTTKKITETRFEITEEKNARPGMMTYTEPQDSTNTKEVIPTGNPENNITQQTDIRRDSVTEIIRNTPNSLIEEPVNRPVAKNNKQKSWMLGAALASNNGVPSGISNNSPLMRTKNIVDATTSYTSIMRANDFQNIRYTPPISFGLMIRRNLDKEMSLETGLLYTYLLTTFENSGLQQNDARLHLHYIGVPINLIARFWNNAKWEIYISGGVMVEKGIQSVYVQNQYYSNQTYTTTALTKIDGLQWSLNGAIGTTYKIQRNVGIFFEPKISYYFDNNQPLSARTEYPVVFGISAGVRFQFK